MIKALDDANEITPRLEEKSISDIVAVAVALFEKRTPVLDEFVKNNYKG